MTPDAAPTLTRLAQTGVVATKGMRPSFPSITFPNHYSLVTGLRPDHHGIVSNTMEDPAISETPFTLGNRAAVTDRRWWDEAEPLWVTAEKAGLRTATMFWPGSEAAIGGVRPSQWAEFDQSLPSATRVKTLLGWLKDPAMRPGFATLYFDIVDTAGHRFGPDSDETRASVREVDAAIGELLAGLKDLGLENRVNLVVVADHGMAAIATDRVIPFDRIAPAGSYRLIETGPYAAVEPMPGQQAALAAALAEPQQHMQCWPKAQVPAQLLYGTNPRAPACLCLA
jgi:hypothetical protein